MKKLLSTLAVVGFALSAPMASAGTLAAEYWDVAAQAGNPVTSGAPVLSAPFLANADAVIASRAADATFTSTGIDYSTPGNSVFSSLNDFLGADSASLSGLGGNSVLGTIFRFTGLVNLAAGNNVFNIFSDDGFRLTVGGVEVGSFDALRAPSSSIVNVAGGAGGLKSFELIYFEAQQVEAALTAKLNGQVIMGEVPLPAGLPLLLGGLAVFGGLRMRKNRAA
jgi:hypothetical protein